MRFDVITLFPELFEPFLQTGVTRRAYETGKIDLKLWQLRDFAQGNYRRVDDRPFGGGLHHLSLYTSPSPRDRG